ncbi:MAG TPA: hypothetical protein VLN49_16510 [Gemmatimonadaceae bacterium]|nr:hypothetical protein [Gemmatimonadaceae bacterium]
MTHLTALEQALLTALLAGDHPALSLLRDQLAVADVTQREFSGVGFFTHFNVLPSAARLAVPRWVISDVDFRLEGLEHGGGALLFVKAGVLSMLEAYTYASEDWPAGDVRHSVSYVTRGKAVGSGHELVPTVARDMAWLGEEYAAAEDRAAAG